MSEFIQLIPIVQAQSLDGVAQPTFGTIEISGGGGVTSSVLISSDKTSVKIGDTFTVKVQVKTNSLTIGEYKIVIDYDKSKLSVIDQDTTTAGTQIKLLDDVFTLEDIEKDNNVSSEGRITLDAKTQSGNAFQVNKDVAEITFQAQSEGSPQIKVVQGTDGTQLIRSNGSSLTFTTNEVTVQTNTTSSTSSGGTPITGGDSGSSSSGSSGSTTGSSSTAGGTVTIPNTAISNEAASLTGITLGVILIITGVIIAKNKQFFKEKTKNHFN